VGNFLGFNSNLMAIFRTFKLNLNFSIFEFFCSATGLASFPQNLVNLFPHHLVALSVRCDHTQHTTFSKIDIEHNGIQQNDTQQNDIQQNDIQQNDTQHNDTQHNDIQHNYTQLNGRALLC
jgi:hypothetical protein